MIALLAAAALAAQDPAQDPVRTVAAVQAMYDQSCQVRAYGTYDDLCSALRKQLSDAKRDEQKALRAKAKTTAPATAETAAVKAADSAAVAANN